MIGSCRAGGRSKSAICPNGTIAARYLLRMICSPDPRSRELRQELVSSRYDAESISQEGSQ
jgi:hypothetical protein